MPSSSKLAGSAKVFCFTRTGAGITGTRFSSFWRSLLALATLALWPAAAAAQITGREGELTVPKVSAVSMEAAGGLLIWHVTAPSSGKIPQALVAVAATEAGGLKISLPAATAPVLTWGTEGVTVRWTPKGEPGDLFGSDRTPTYPLGPGDKLQITVYNVEDMDQQVVVDPMGNVTFPVLDKVSVLGLTVNELQKKFEELLSQYIKGPQVNAQLLEYGSRFVNVLGEVQASGRLPIKGTLRILDAISQAGGFTEKSGDVEVQRRDASGQLKTKVIAREDLMGTGTKANLFVLDQDVINVLPMKQIYVSGEVKSPGAITWYKDLTLLRAIAKQGGFTQWARKEKVDILRDDGKGGTTTIRVDARAIEKGELEDPPLHPNDHVVVNERKFL